MIVIHSERAKHSQTTDCLDLYPTDATVAFTAVSLAWIWQATGGFCQATTPKREK